jgi:adenine-specific DNA-methyltransferase
VVGYKGRLELDWTNKQLRLLAHEDGSYEWLPPSDYRIAEVRLLHDRETVGDVGGSVNRARDNLLIRGDALNALTSLVELPEFAREYVSKVKLVYLDPPFNTQQSFLHYDDALEHSVWLTMMRDRLLQVKALLSPEGSVWVHCDDSEQHRLRCVMDEVFGPQAWVATVIWQKRVSRDNRPAFSTMHDYIHIYSPLGIGWSQVRNRLVDEGEYGNPDNDPKGPWRSIPLSAQAGHATPAQFYELVTPTGVKHRPPKGRAWTYTKERFEELVAQGRVYWPKGGDGIPRLKKYPWESEGLVPFTIWLASEVGDNDEAKKQILEMFSEVEPFGTPKPEGLMHRIIHMGSNQGDIVLDCFLGSGTTAAVAHKMGRRWVGIEVFAETLDTYAIPRLKKVVAGADAGGITETVGWQGAGGFRVLDVAPSMFAEASGQVFLSDWATNGKLAEATAAQLHYDYVSDPPFSGRRGRSRLAVIDGLVNEAVIQLLLKVLPDNERLVVCGTAIDPAVRDALRAARPGSSVRKIPASILQEYRQANRWIQTRLPDTAPETDGAAVERVEA